VPPPQQTPDDPAFERLLEFLRVSRGFDFAGYKRSTLRRRVARRMQEVGIDDVDGYLDYLEVHPDEFASLFNTILINVTSFFRDPATWELVRDEVVPDLVERRSGAPIRVWSAGCASGQEPYSVAMLFAEAVGPDALRERVKIYATDVDEDALEAARAGVYAERELGTLPEELRDRYLERLADDRYAFRKELRRTVIFGRHDLVQDPPISRIDLLLCRNTLMYFNADVQSRIYRNFHFSLAPDGYLVLGKSEMLLTRTSMFAPIDLKRRVFRKTLDEAELARRDAGERARAAAGEPERDILLLASAFEGAATAQLAVDAAGFLVGANAVARSDLNVAQADVGRSFYELELSYRPLELRGRIEEAIRERRPVVQPSVAVPSSQVPQRTVDVVVTPLLDVDRVLGATVTFIDSTQASELRRDLDRAQRELEAAYEEIQATVEELETTNEELQSTNEELETTNEELQSTNEELETMNEELQSTNDELETINAELRDRTMQANHANAFLESVLSSLNVGVALLDRNLAVLGWNGQAEELWGLREAEALGEHLFNLDIGLPLETLRAPIRACLAGLSRCEEVELDATNRRGRSLRCKVTCSQMGLQDGQPAAMTDGEVIEGVILLMEPLPASEPA
jgi:two-component system CheB/CheR fusion protein